MSHVSLLRQGVEELGHVRVIALLPLRRPYRLCVLDDKLEDGCPAQRNELLSIVGKSRILRVYLLPQHQLGLPEYYIIQDAAQVSLWLLPLPLCSSNLL